MTRGSLLIVTTAAAVGALGLTGCNASTSSCDSSTRNGVVDATCTFDLKDYSKSTELPFYVDPDKSRPAPADSLRLTSATEGGQARFDVGDQSFTCRQGEQVPVGPATATCEVVGDKRLKMTLATN